MGKTLGYIAPASLWAERNEGAVWISTYTRNLQHQIAAELDRLYPEPAEKNRRVVVRKGRENYLCLLNLEDALQGGFAGRAYRQFDLDTKLTFLESPCGIQPSTSAAAATPPVGARFDELVPRSWQALTDP